MAYNNFKKNMEAESEAHRKIGSTPAHVRGREENEKFYSKKNEMGKKMKFSKMDKAFRKGEIHPHARGSMKALKQLRDK